MSDTDSGASIEDLPLPPIPGIKTYISQAAGALVVGLPVIAHELGFTNFPALDQNAVGIFLTLLVAAGFSFHRYGLNTVAQYILKNLGPIVQKVVRDELQAQLANAQVQQTVASFATMPSLTSPAPNVDLSPFSDVLSAFGVKPTQAPSPQAFVIDGHAFEPADLLRAVEPIAMARLKNSSTTV